jgi:glycosyltransferase involved in cell wall biosynthesis
MKNKKNLDLSLVIPVYNEAENLEILYREIKSSCENLGKSYEVIFIDDGSTDGSFSVLTKIRKRL